MQDEPGVQAKSERGSAKKRGIEGRDISGIVLGAPILPIGLQLVIAGFYGILSHHEIPYYFVLGVILLLASVGLCIPGKLYEWKPSRAISYAAAVLATGVSAGFAVLVGVSAQWLFSNADDEWALLGVFFAAAGLAGFGYALGCTVVLLMKLRPRLVHAAITVAVGVAVGALNILLMYVLHCSPFFDTAG